MDYDTKLGEWFKQVEKKAEELRARKVTPPSANQSQPPISGLDEASAPVQAVETQLDSVFEGVGEPQPIEASASVATAEMVGEPVAVSREVSEPPVRMPALFEDNEAPPVEDFLSFLSRTEEKAAEPEEKPLDLEIPSDRSPLGLSSEGTGEPRPIAPRQEPEKSPVLEPVMEASVIIAAPEIRVVEEVAPKPAPQPVAVPKPTAQPRATRFPQQLQNLLHTVDDEVAQNSYKAFKESRAGLIERLLDPPLTLEEAARILNVCPTTVRRYTNRGILKHFRTAGNQRRFKLSDVLSFMESQFGIGPASDATATDPA